MAKSKPNAQESALFKQIAPSELSKGELRKLQIIQAAIESLGRSGWLGTNYETVGKLCGMKRPHVAYHYPEWSDLIDACIKFAYGTGQSVVSEHLKLAPPGKLLECYVRGTYDWLTHHTAHTSVIALLWHLTTFDARYRNLYEGISRVGLERVFACLYSDSPHGTKDPRWNVARRVHNMIVGSCIEIFSSNDKGSIESVVQSIAESARKLAVAKPGKRK